MNRGPPSVAALATRTALRLAALVYLVVPEAAGDALHRLDSLLSGRLRLPLPTAAPESLRSMLQAMDVPDEVQPGGTMGLAPLRAAEQLVPPEAELNARHPGREAGRTEEAEHAREDDQEDQGEEAADGEDEQEDNEEGAGEEEGEAEKEEEFSNVDVAISFMLLGAVGFVMSLFSLVNYPDEDMRFYAWSVISTTLSIFVSVLMFQGVSTAAHAAVEHYGGSKMAHVGVAFTLMLFFFILLQVVVASISGVLAETPYKGDVHEMEKQREDREINMKCYATLISHMSGFASINLGRNLLRARFFETHPPVQFLVAIVMLFIQLLFGWVMRTVRQLVISHKRKKHSLRPGYARLNSGKLPLNEETGKAIALHMWDDEVYESENDIAGLCVSFLTVQSCLFNIVGLEEVESPGDADVYCTTKVLVVAGLFATATVLSVMAYNYVPHNEPANHHHHEERQYNVLKRLTLVMQNTMAMAFAWSLLGACKWEMIRNLPVLGGLESTTFRVMLALLVSFVVFILVLFLDVLRDSPITGETADLAIESIIKALGILVGFSWEQSFHLGVEVIARALPDILHWEAARRPVVGQLALAILVAAVVIVPWRKYILKKHMTLTEERVRAAKGEAHQEEYTKVTNVPTEIDELRELEGSGASDTPLNTPRTERRAE